MLKTITLSVFILLCNHLIIAHEIGLAYVLQHTNDWEYGKPNRNGYAFEYSHTLKHSLFGLKWSESYANNRSNTYNIPIRTGTSVVSTYFLIKLLEVSSFKAYAGPNIGVTSFYSSDYGNINNTRASIGITFNITSPNFFKKRFFARISIDQRFARAAQWYDASPSLGSTTSISDFYVGLYYRITKVKN